MNILWIKEDLRSRRIKMKKKKRRLRHRIKRQGIHQVFEKYYWSRWELRLAGICYKIWDDPLHVGEQAEHPHGDLSSVSSCDSSYQERESNSHIDSCHKKQVKFVCWVCGFLSMKADTLGSHMRQEHVAWKQFLDFKIFFCKLCVIKFASSNRLIYHMARSLFKCNQCDIILSSLNHINEHEDQVRLHPCEASYQASTPRLLTGQSSRTTLDSPRRSHSSPPSCPLCLPSLFKESALWADSFYKWICPCVCVGVPVCMSILMRYRLNLFLPPLPKVQCKNLAQSW